jgi:hypothetical protein
MEKLDSSENIIGLDIIRVSTGPSGPERLLRQFRSEFRNVTDVGARTVR